MNYTCVKNIIHSSIMAILASCALIWVLLSDNFVWSVKIMFAAFVGFYVLLHIVRFLVSWREYIITEEEDDMEFKHNGWLISCGDKSYPISYFPGEALLVRGFFKGKYRVEKPLNYMGKCTLKIVDRHPVTGKKLSFIRKNVVYYIDEEGGHHLVDGAEKDIDTLRLGMIRAEYEVYVYAEDYYEDYPQQ